MGSMLGFFTMPHPPIIISEVGRGEEEKIKGTTEACNKVAEEIEALKPDTIILVTPHGPLFSNAVSISSGKTISGSLANFRAPQVSTNLEIDNLLTEKIIKNAKARKVPTVELNERSVEAYNIEYEPDHGAIVPLYFVTKKYLVSQR